MKTIKIYPEEWDNQLYVPGDCFLPSLCSDIMIIEIETYKLDTNLETIRDAILPRIKQ